VSYLLKAENISYGASDKSFLKKNFEEKEILKNISFEIDKGTVLGISGESGSGKTTLAKIIAGILIPSRGRITFNSQNEIRRKNRVNPIQILFQNNGEILNPLREINKVVAEAVIISSRKEDPYEKMTEIFKSVDFPERLWKRKGYELSGGEQQRAALARILAVNPELLVLDEPFSAQDPESRINLLNLFSSINKKLNITMICISHNLRLLQRFCDEIIIMYQGEIVEKEKTETIFFSPKHPYTKFLLKAENYDLSYEELKYNTRAGLSSSSSSSS
jgi:peptide/nickel transport system ATP-binding protein